MLQLAILFWHMPIQKISYCTSNKWVDYIGLNRSDLVKHCTKDPFTLQINFKKLIYCKVFDLHVKLHMYVFYEIRFKQNIMFKNIWSFIFIINRGSLLVII